jgi:Protein kinase domain
VAGCLACGAALASETRFCPECGASLSQSGEDTETRLAPRGAASGPASRPSSGSSSGSPSGWLSTSAVVDEGRFLPGAIIAGRYRMIGPLGKGGMGEVYRADDLRLGQPVALKFLPESVGSDPARLAQFHQEVRSARQVSHPNVCRVYDVGEVDGLTFLSMEYVDGEDLASLAKRIGRLSPDKALDLSRQLCAGLAAAHDRGVLHRDLKPANLMLDGRGQLRITDFGLAGLVGEVGPRAGTPAYMAPEQLTGQPATIQSDIYALGLVMYELFTGQRPFDFRSIAELMQRHDEGIPPPSSFVTGLDMSVDRAILRCLERDPANRPASVRKALAALPGGDPLAAALAAGETPSPEMVPAAGETSAVRPVVGPALAAFVVVGIAVVVALFDRILLANQVPFERSPAVLEDRAQEIIRRLGYAEPPADTATGLVVWMDPLRWIARTDSAPNRWERLRTASPPGILFWYRESPHPLVPNRRSGLVSFADPPMTSAGMVSVILDPRGRLLELHAVPPRRDDNAAAPVASDVDALFTAAGLDRSRFVEVEPTVTPRAFADSRAAWEGAMSDDASTKVRVETGTYRGRPIQFQIVAPWTQLAAGQQALAPGRGEQLLGVLEALVVPGLLVVGAVMARRNLLRGRGDRRGAAAAGLFVLVTSIAAWALAATHASGIDTEIDRLFNVALASALFSAANLWVWYIALEPYVRRFWPNALLGWARLVAGHVRDPRVGLEVLAGAACGTLMTLIFAAHDPLAPVIGGLAPIPQVRARSAARHTVRSRIPPRKLARGVAQRNDRSVRSRVLPGDVQAAALDRLLAGHDRLHTGGPPGNVPRGSGPPWRSRWRLPSWARS